MMSEQNSVDLLMPWSISLNDGIPKIQQYNMAKYMVVNNGSCPTTFDHYSNRCIFGHYQLPCSMVKHGGRYWFPHVSTTPKHIPAGKKSTGFISGWNVGLFPSRYMFMSPL